jgi:hypothetical protein
MIAITEYHFKNYGFTLPAACIQVTEVQTSKEPRYYDGTTSAKNTLVRIHVWASENAKTEGMQPIEMIEKYIDLSLEMTNDIHNTALLVLFPDAITTNTAV